MQEQDKDNVSQEPTEEWPEPVKIEDVVSPEFLQMISLASGGFSFREDPRLAQEALETGMAQTGWTHIPTRTIYFNPLLREGNKKLGVKPWTRADILGFTTHEAGHHAPEVKKFNDLMIEDLKDPDIVPEPYRASPDHQTRFLQALYSHLDNSLADIWLESFMGRKPFRFLGSSIREFQTGKGKPETLQNISKPEQLMQALIRGIYIEDPSITSEVGRKAISKDNVKEKSVFQDKVDEDVFEAYQRVLESGAMRALIDNSYFAMPARAFISEAELENQIKLKFRAYKQVFLPEYLKMVEAEIEERKKQQSQLGQPQSGRSGAVPLTPEEEQGLLEQLLKELEKAGQDHKPEKSTLSEEEQRKLQQLMNKLSQMAKQRQQEGQNSDPNKKPGEEQRLKGIEAIEAMARKFRESDKESDLRGLAESMRVQQETVRTWDAIKEKYKLEIESTAAAYAEIFLDDRRKRLEFLKREGEIVPGLEYETIAALISGELDPETKMREVVNPDFLELEKWFILDQSSSMAGEQLEKSIEMMIIDTEALKLVRQNLEDEGLLFPEEEYPFRIAETGFTTVPHEITSLDEPLSDKKELTMIEESKKVGGGTEETGTISQVYKKMSLKRGNVIKLITVFTDGEGNMEGLIPIMQQIEEDDEVIFLVVGLGADANSIVESYLSPLKEKSKNIFGIAAENPAEALPQVIDFYKREVIKKRRSY